MIPSLHVVIRVDSSAELGSGHVLRCLTLALALCRRGGDVVFVCRELQGNCSELIEKQGFKVFRLPGNDELDAVQDAEQTVLALGRRPDWIIADHYDIGAQWERTLRPHTGRIMAIDDLANRPHDCDLLLDQNLFVDMLPRYDGLTPPGCQLFLGPRYALLREEFISTRRTLRERDGNVRRMLLFFGGSDPTNETEKALLTLKQLNLCDISVDVVVGSANPNGAKIHDICAALPNVVFHRQVSNMAELMANADLAIGAGGTATWERCYLGLPALVVVVAKNQSKPAQAADNAGLARLLGNSAEVTVASLADAMGEALRQPDALEKMSKRCLSFMGQRNTSVNDELLTCLYEGTDVP